MEHDQTTDRNYWHLLDAARAALDAGDFVAAERRFLAAVGQREASPGRVFLTENLGDGLARLLRGRKRADAEPAVGRWERESGAFTTAFMAASERAVREGVRLAELRPEDDAAANQPVLEAALFLVVRSSLFPEEFSSAVPLLKGLFRTAARTARVFDVQLIRHDVPLTEEDRLWLARRGGDLLEIFAEQGKLVRGSGPAREWAAAVLQLLQPRYFGSSGRLAEERAWLEAVSADRLLGDAEASVRLYRAYLQTNPEPGPRSDEARVRTLELLANIDADHFPVPRYAEALGALQSAGLAQGSEQAGRYGTAVARIEYRRPEPDAGIVAAAWASAALGADGTVAVVLWWGSEPRDLARWTPGEGVEPLDLFLAPCAGRIVARDVATLAAAGAAWPEPPAAWPIGQLVEALGEPDLPRGGLDEAALRRLAGAEGGPWRAGWRRELGLPQLKPADDWAADARADTGLGRALLAGLVVLGLRNRITGSDPALRAGLAELARRGDAGAAVFYDVLTAGDEAARAMDASFAAWTVPLLWTRPDPFSAPGQPSAAAESVRATRPDLGRNDVALVSSGDPAAVMAAWGAGHGRWRVVLDRMDRLADLAPASAGVIGPVTVIPPGGRVHRLDAALARLDALVRRRPDPDDPTAGLLAVFHWVRIVCTHNGDLLDFQAVRPWLPGAFALYDRYAAAIADLPREVPRLATAGDDDGWGAQFSQRARKAGFVAGQVADLPLAAERLDGLWGVFEGSGASWVFLDAAVVHAHLAAAGEAELPARHALLAQRGQRHLSLLTGAVWCRDELQDLLAGWLGSYGPVYRLALTDLRTPPLVLADRGPVPGGRRLEAEALAGALAHVGLESEPGASRLVVLPQRERGAAFWRAAQGGRFGVRGDTWDLIEDASVGPPPGAEVVLVVPELTALTAAVPTPDGGDADNWRTADEARARWAAAARRRCSLEIAAYLAGGWAAVEILDARWWRLLRDDSVGADDPAAAAAGPWTGVRAAALAATGRARCLDLPETAGDARRRLAPALVAEVAGWVAGRGAEAREPEPAAAWPAAGTHLVVGPPAPARRALLAALGGAWERGRLEPWALLVARESWPEAAALAAEVGVAGCSAWPAGQRAPAPVLWVRPDDLADADLLAYLARHRPTVAVVPDLTSWLPGPERAAQGEAAALRVLLGQEIPAVLLQTATLPPAWQGFLAAATGVTVSGGGGPQAATGPAGGLPAAMLVARLRRLLGQLRPLLAQRRGNDDSGRQPAGLEGLLIPVTRLAHLAGLDAGQVRAGLRLLRWAARLAGDPLSAEEDGTSDSPAPVARSHGVLVGSRFADLEMRLDQLREAMGLFLPLWLGRLPVGGRTWVDLNQPPAQIDPTLLVQLDTWLLEGGAAASGLDYTAPRGVLNSTRRLVALSQPLPRVQAAVQANLDLFGRRLQDVMSAAVETGAGFLVDTGLEQLRAEEQAFLTLGASLDFWHWCGPPGAEALPLVDLLTLADSQTVRRGQDAWTMVGALGGAAPQVAEPEPGRAGGAGRLRTLLGQADPEAPDAEAVALVAALAGEAAEPTYLVLKGLAGSGRLDAVVAGLKRAAARAADPGEVMIFCPDAGAGAALARRALRAGLALDLRLPTAGDLPEPVTAPLAGPAGHDDVIVVLDVQRFTPEVRYRIAQHGRGRRLLLTVDPAASGESWENLFLTTPRTSDVHTCDEQRDQARRLWDQVRTLAPASAVGETRTRRRDRGELAAEYAANLDQCVARILQGRTEGQLPTRLRLTAPLPADLEFLAMALRDHGWLVVDEAELDALFLPGPCDLLAAAADLLADGGSLRAAQAMAASAAETATPAPAESGLLAALPRGGAAPPCWPPQSAPDPQATTLAALAARLLADADLAPALVHASARRRIEALLSRWGGRTLVELPREPLWQAWWVTLRTDLGRGDPAPDRPLVRLTPAAGSPAVGVAGGVYLCLGGEDARQHYRILSRITDTALVLYQDRSPLDGS